MKTKLILLLFVGWLNLQGQTVWQRIESLNDTFLYKIYAMTTDTLFVTGQNLIAKSTDYGDNWQRTIIPNDILMRSILFTNKDTGVAVGDKGTIYKTTDRGTTWSIRIANTTNNLYAIAKASSGSIWVVGDYGTVLISNDNGETWIVSNFSTLDNFKDIKFYGSEGYIVGENRSFYKTIDAGTNWIKESQIVDESTFFYIQKTANDLYISAGSVIRPYASYKKDNSGAWTILAGGTGLCMLNNGTGYSLDAGILTNGGENIMKLHKIENNSDMNENTIFRSWAYCIDDNHTDISIANDTMIYALSGKVLLKSSPDIINGVKKTYNIFEKINIKENLNGSLTVKTNHPLVNYELMNISGSTLLTKSFLIGNTETNVRIPNIPKGIYLLKIKYSNNKTEIHKWIKH
jgi:hypothetical protein